MFGLGTTELLVIFGILILLFGAKRIPELASGLGKSIGNFKRAVRTNEDGGEPKNDTEKKG